MLKARAEGDDSGPETSYYLLGTAHVSAESCGDVAALIRAVRPQVRRRMCRRSSAAMPEGAVPDASHWGARPAAGSSYSRPPATSTSMLLFPTRLNSPRIASQVVLVELCSERKPILTADKVREPSLSEVLAEIRAGRATPFQGVYSWCARLVLALHAAGGGMALLAPTR